MAEKGANTDNEVGIDMNDFAGDLPQRLPLGRNEGEKFGAAIANKELIIEIAQMLQTLADYNLEVEQETRNAEVEERKIKLKRRVSVKDYFSSCSKKVFETLDIVLEWLEQSAKKAKDEADKKKTDKIQPCPQSDKTDGDTTDKVDGQPQNTDEYQKKEGVLRGLYHITGLGSYTCYVGLLELASKFLDLPENPYNAKRDHVKECLKEVEEQKQKVFELVEKACNILQEITRDPQFNQSKAAEYNSIVRQADIIIESCNDLLSDAEETIDELMKIMSTMKIFSRVLRFAGFGATCYSLYHMRPSSSTVDTLAPYIPSTGLTLIKNLFLNPSMKYATFGVSCAVSGYAWLSLFPSRAYAFRDDLTELKLKHKRLARALNRLDRRLKTVVEDFHDRSKQWSNREDSV